MSNERRIAMPAGMIAATAVSPFFVLPILGMVLGRPAGGLGIFAGTLLGFVLAIGVARLLGKRLEGKSPRP